MFLQGFLINLPDGNFLFSLMTEPVTLLVFGISLVGATAGLRRILKRHDEVKPAAVVTEPEEIIKG